MGRRTYCLFYFTKYLGGSWAKSSSTSGSWHGKVIVFMSPERFNFLVLYVDRLLHGFQSPEMLEGIPVLCSEVAARPWLELRLAAVPLT